MADLKLKRLKMRNWMKFRDVDLEFPDQGLILVQGLNTASGGALASVGSGKTAVGEALCRTLLGITGRFTSAKQYSLDKQGDLYVRLEAELLGKPLLVEAGYACDEFQSSGEALSYTHGGTRVERGRMQETRAQLAKLLGVSPQLADWTAFIDGERLKFNRLSQADSVSLVMAALRQPEWSSYFEILKKKSGEFQVTAAKDSQAHATAIENLTDAQRDLDAAKDAYLAAKEEHQRNLDNHEAKINEVRQRKVNLENRLKEISAKMQEIKTQLKLMEDERAKKSHDIEINIHKVEDVLTALDDEKEKLLKTRDTRQETMSTTRTARQNYLSSAANCPTCNRPRGKLDPERQQELEAAYQKGCNAFNEINEQLSQLNEKIKAKQQSLRDLRKEFSEASASDEVKQLSDDYEDLVEKQNANEDRVQDLDVELAGLKAPPSDSNVVRAATTLKASKAYLQKCQDKLDAAAVSVTQNDFTAKVIKYWYTAFSSYGIPNLVLREAIGPLNHEARRVSAAMTGGTIDIRFSTVRELASGQEKAQLHVEVDNKLGDKELAGSSKGEGGLTNFIIAETLSEVGQVSRRLGFRWYDEILPHQDPKVCQSIYSYMKDVAQRLGILVFLVDHNPVAANYADHVLIVEKHKRDQVASTIRWR